MIACLLILLLTPVVAFAQTAEELGLVLTGTIVSNKANSEKLSAFELRMVIENKGAEPVIIINPTLGYGTGLTEASFAFHDFQRDKFDKSIKVFEIDDEKLNNFKSMAKYFEGVRPSENMTRILAPGESFSFIENLEVEKSYVLKISPQVFSAKRKMADGSIKTYSVTGTSTSRYSYFTLKYEYSFLKYSEDPDLLEKMSQRWRPFGRLPVGTDGTYTITSEPIKERK